MVLCSDYKYSKPIEHYAIFTAYFYLSFRFIHCFVAGRSTGLRCFLSKNPLRISSLFRLQIAIYRQTKEFASRNPSSSSCAAMRFLPDNCSERTSIQPSAHRIRRYLRLSVSIVPHGAYGPPASKRASKILAEFASCSSRSSRVQAAG